MSDQTDEELGDENGSAENQAEWSEIADAVYLLRQPVLDVNATLVVGDRMAAVIDTLSTNEQAGQLLGFIRTVTSLPLVLINTHHHFDHCFGNAVLVEASPGAGVFAHEAAAVRLRDHGERLRRKACESYESTLPGLARAMADVVIHPPDHAVVAETTLDIGRRTLVLRHLGRAHTDGDLLVWIDDAHLLLAGDLVEAAGVAFDDSYPVAWPQALAAALEQTAPGTAVAPGHGPVTDLDFVRAQHDELNQLAWLIRDGHADGARAEDVAVRASDDHPRLSPKSALTAVERGYAELSGRI